MVSVLMFGLVGIAGLAVVLRLFGDEEDFAEDDPDGEEEEDVDLFGAEMRRDGQVPIGDTGDDDVSGRAGDPRTGLSIETVGGGDSVTDLHSDNSAISTSAGNDTTATDGITLNVA